MCVLGFVDVYGVLKCVNPFCVCVLILCSDMIYIGIVLGLLMGSGFRV